MNVRFKKIIIHHFLSYDHAELDLQDKGFCLVSGINRNPKDASKSNGAGKSTAFNAISFALTGETLQGLKSNLPNIYFNDGCYVQLDVSIDGHEYSILRSKDDKKLGTDLKITVDGEDRSGKTLTDSKAILEQLLPDLTGELIGSVIMLGQGMPMKFTSNSPSGRKEVLEHLSQSDFMIQDIKDRIARRQSELSTQSRAVEDKLLENSTQESIYSRQLVSANQEYESYYAVAPNFDEQLKDLIEKKTKNEEEFNVLKAENTRITNELSDVNPKLLMLSKEKESTFNKVATEHAHATEEFSSRRTEISSKKFALEQEIARLKSIKDVCPTCGQKIPEAVKSDTTKQEEQLQQYIKALDGLRKEVEEDTEDYNEVLKKINNKYDDKIQELQQSVRRLQESLAGISLRSTSFESTLKHVENAITNVEKDKEFFETNKSKILKNIRELQGNLVALNNAKEKLDKDKDSIDEHNAIISKMNTIVKRDFRGFLLKNIIDYINSKAKEYSSKIFGCDEMSFVLEGNNINISFCDKDYENLSGGEQQRVNLITQFAIRDFMCQYLQFSSNILVLDEITDALDAESCDRVINFITSELKDIESVFIISHHSDELAILCDSEIVIEKNEVGVSNVIY